MTFARIVFISGLWNIGLGLSLVVPPIYELLGMQIPNPFFGWIVAGFLWYTSATLIVSSRSIEQFAPIIMWEAVLRFFAVTVLILYGFTYLGKFPTILMGVTDFAWGIIYVIGLKRTTGHSARWLLGRK